MMEFDGPREQTAVASAIRRPFTRPDRKGTTEVSRRGAGLMWPHSGKLAALMDESGSQVPGYTAQSARPLTRRRGPNPLKRPNNQGQPRAIGVGHSPNEEAVTHLFGAVLFEQTEDWLNRHRSRHVEAFALADPSQTGLFLSPSAQVA